VIWLASQLGLSETYLIAADWSDAIQELPDGSHIVTEEIKKALDGDDFRFYPEDERFPVVCSGVEPMVFAHYMNIFNNCDQFGLPHGGGWLDEQPWLLQFVSYMKAKKSAIEAWHIRLAGKNNG